MNRAERLVAEFDVLDERGLRDAVEDLLAYAFSEGYSSAELNNPVPSKRLMQWFNEWLQGDD